MRCPLDDVLVSAVNPFERSYHHLQHQFDSRIVELLSEILRLNLTLVLTPLITDLNTYERNPDSWVVEQIVNGTAEMSSTSLILTPKSTEAVDYSFGISTFRPQLYYRARSLREDYNIYLRTFSVNLWLSLIAAIFLLTLTLTFILSREAKLPHEISYDVLARIIDIQQDRDEEWSDINVSPPKEVLREKEKWEIGEILLVCLGAFCQQGSARDPSTNAARLLLLVFFVMTVVGYTAYSASIISFISLLPSTELEQTGDLEVFSRQYTKLLHNTNKNTNISQMGFQEAEYTNIQTGFEKALKGEAVFVGDRDVSLTFLHTHNYSKSLRCQLGRAFLGMEYSRVLALKKNFKYKEKINYNILRLKQSGLLERERRRIFNVKPPCTFRERSSRSTFVSFTKDDVSPVVILFKLGVAISLLFLLAEHICFYCPVSVKKLLPKPMKGRIKANEKSRKQYKKNENLLPQNKINMTSLDHKEKTNMLSSLHKRVPQKPFLL